MLCIFSGTPAGAGTGESRFRSWGAERGSAPADLTVAGDKLYFVADDGCHGRELWCIDSEGRCQLVGDFWPGPLSSAPGHLVVVGDSLCFVGRRPHGNPDDAADYVWRTNGTAGTTVCVAEPRSDYALSMDVSLASAGGKLFGARTSPRVGREMVAYTDGGVIDTVPGVISGVRIEQEYFADIGAYLLFTVQPASRSSRTLYALDPSSRGSDRTRVLAGGADGYSFPMYCKALGDALWFTAGTETMGMELFVSDGTPSGTRQVSDINPGLADSTPKDFYRHRGWVYFQAHDGVHGVELWRTDGTASGTQLVCDINPGPASSNPYNFASAGANLVFAAGREGEGTELWCTDGTASGTRLVRDFMPGPASSNPYQPFSYGDVMLFSAGHPEYGEELWRSDGTPEGTSLVRDILPGRRNSEPYYLTAFNGLVYFTANDGTHGEEVWRTDGTAAGTQIAADIRTEPMVVRSSNPTSLTALGDFLYFAADDLQHGDELWVHDLERGEVRLAADIAPGASASAPAELLTYDDVLFFSAFHPSHGRELWRADAAAGEVSLVADLLAGAGSSGPRLLVDTPQGLLFVAGPGGGASLWLLADSTRAPRRVCEVADTGLEGTVRRLRQEGGVVYLCAEDDAGQYHFGVYHLETEAFSVLPVVLPAVVTRALLLEAEETFAPNAVMQAYLSLPAMAGGAGRMNDQWYFALRTAEYGAEVWSTRSGIGDAQLLRDCMPGTASGGPRDFVSVGPDLYFSAERGAGGRVLWVTDGTRTGTVVVAIRAGDPSVVVGPLHLTAGADRLYCSARGGVYYGENRALVTCERSLNGFFAAKASEPERYWPYAPRAITLVGGWIYFSGEDPATGRELWRYRVEDVGPLVDSCMRYEQVCNIAPDPGYPVDVQVSDCAWRK